MNGAMELLRAAQEGDRDACEQAVLENNGLIWSVVRRYYGRGVEPDDLYQLGCLGFLKAIRGFDFSYGTCFSTYAVPKIAGEIRRFLRDDGTIKVGRSIREQSLTLYALRERLRQELGREPVLSELAEQTGLSKSALGKYENEDCGDINHYAIQKLAKFYGVSTDYLLGLTEQKNTQMWTWRPCI